MTGVPSEYFNTIQGIIQQTVVYPPKAVRDDDEGKVMVRLRVKPDGTILEVHIEEKSGYVELDREALEVFQRIGKFPPVPNATPDAAAYEVVVPINFSLE